MHNILASPRYREDWRKPQFLPSVRYSLLAAQAAVRVKEVFGVGLELRTFLVSPTVAALAKQVESRSSARRSLALSAKDEREEFEI